MATLQFLGAAGVVTGSKYLVKTDQHQILVDCGLFQGSSELKGLNWASFPMNPAAIDAIVLTHAHIDHSGYLPRLTKQGYRGKVHCTDGTADLLGVLLPDSGFLQEEEARQANRKGWSRHSPHAEPLFTLLDAQRALRQVRCIDYGVAKEILPGVQIRFVPNGHIVGSAALELILEEKSGKTVIVFSGDVGRYGSPLMRDPLPVSHADVLLIESTYGDRQHPDEAVHLAFKRVVREAVARGGMLVIPSFAVGRTQQILYTLKGLEDKGDIPELDVYVDSPMAVDATQILLDHTDDLTPSAAEVLRHNPMALTPKRTHFVREAADSKGLNSLGGPGVIISASGMATGGRIKHHLLHRLPGDKNTICFVGFQAEGTKGRQLLEGASTLFIYGQEVKVRAHIEKVEGFSAHGDRRDLLKWLGGFQDYPKQVFVVHGEKPASEAFAETIRQELGWHQVVVPAYKQEVELASGGASRAAYR